jgi:hypothetical protein
MSRVLEKSKVSCSFLKELIEDETKPGWVVINIICRTQSLSEEFIIYLLDKAFTEANRIKIYYIIEGIVEYQQLSEKFIRRLVTNRNIKYSICWPLLFQNQSVSEEFIKDWMMYNTEYKEHFICSMIIKHQNISESFLIELIETHDIIYREMWKDVSYNQKLSIDFIRKYYTKLDIYGVLEHPDLQQDYIPEIIDNISTHPTCKQSDIQLFTYRAHLWLHVSKNQNTLSEEFIRKNINQLCLRELLTHHSNITERFRREINDFIMWRNGSS